MENQKDVKVCLYDATFKDEVRAFISALENTQQWYSTNQLSDRGCQRNILVTTLSRVYDCYSDSCVFVSKLPFYRINIGYTGADWLQNLIIQLRKLVEPTLQDVYNNYEGNRLDKLKVYAEHLYSITAVKQRVELIEMLKQVTDEDLRHVCVTFVDAAKNFKDRLSSAIAERHADGLYRVCTNSDVTLCYFHTSIGILNIKNPVREQYSITPVQVEGAKSYIFPISTD